MTHPPQPTNDQCRDRARLPDFDMSGTLCPCFATYYPQMGGYVSRAVVVVLPAETKGETDGCFDVYVWHDGEFPFDENDPGNHRGPVAYLHHCMPSQFINFGQFVLDRQEQINKELS